MLAWSEGTSTIKASDDGYNVLVGGELFTDYSKHPRVLVPLPRYRISSTAAGRYQYLARTWDAIVKNYGLKGRFIPEAQDLAAIKLLAGCGALPLIKAGRIPEAIAKAAPFALLLLLTACAGRSPDCAMADQLPAIPSLPSSARQEPLPSWCSGDCLKTLTEWREASRKRLSEVE